MLLIFYRSSWLMFMGKESNCHILNHMILLLVLSVSKLQSRALILLRQDGSVQYSFNKSSEKWSKKDQQCGLFFWSKNCHLKTPSRNLQWHTVKYFREFKYIGILFWMVYSKYSYGSRIQFNFIYIMSVTILFQSLTHKQASKSG